jgi:hypothetical protein
MTEDLAWNPSMLIGARTGQIHFCENRLGCGVVHREIPPRLRGGLRVEPFIDGRLP